MAATSRPLRVLVADDEHAIADSLTTIFRSHGFDARSVYSGYSAIETAVKFDPDVVISDVTMPGVNGIDAVLSISRQWPNSRFLLFTGNADCQESLERARAGGLRLACLHKPVPPRLLIEYLRECANHLNLDYGAGSASIHSSGFLSFDPV